VIWGDEGDLMALRYGNWKVHFAVQRAEGLRAWQDQLEHLRFPILVNLPRCQGCCRPLLFSWSIGFVNPKCSLPLASRSSRG